MGCKVTPVVAASREWALTFFPFKCTVIGAFVLGLDIYLFCRLKQKAFVSMIISLTSFVELSLSTCALGKNICISLFPLQDDFFNIILPCCFL